MKHTVKHTSRKWPDPNWMRINRKLTCRRELSDRSWLTNQHAQARRTFSFIWQFRITLFGELSLTEETRLVEQPTWVKEIKRSSKSLKDVSAATLYLELTPVGAGDTLILQATVCKHLGGKQRLLVFPHKKSRSPMPISKCTRIQAIKGRKCTLNKRSLQGQITPAFVLHSVNLHRIEADRLGFKQRSVCLSIRKSNWSNP